MMLAKIKSLAHQALLRSQLRGMRLRLHNLKTYGHPLVFSSIVIETYSPCNRSCSCCPVGYEKRTVSKMGDDLFFRLIDQLANENYQGEICLHFFNEPLLDKRLPEFVSYAHRKCPKSFIFFHTNGDHLDLETFRDLVDRGLSRVIISQYDKVPSPALRGFLESATVLDRRHFQFRVIVVDEIASWGNRGGAIKKWGLKHPLKKRCSRPEFQLVVNAAGQVPLCCCDYSSQENLGDITKENVFAIWRSKRLGEIRSHLRAGDRKNIALCRGCNWYDEEIQLPRKRKNRISGAVLDNENQLPPPMPSASF